MVDMASEGQPPRHSQIPDNLRPSNLLSQSLHFELLPSERFRDMPNLQNAIALTSIDESIAVLRKFSDHYSVLVYNENGIATEINLDPTTYVLAKSLPSSHIYIAKNSRVGSSSRTSNSYDLFKGLGYSKDISAILRSNWEKYTQTFFRDDEYIMPDHILSKPEVFFSSGSWTLNTVDFEGRSGRCFKVGVGETERFVSPGKPLELLVRGAGSVMRENLITDELKIKKGVASFAILNKEDVVLGDFSGFDPHLSSVSQNLIYFINAGKIYNLDIGNITNTNTKAIPTLLNQISVSNPEELEIDPNGNFLIIRNQGSKLSIVDLESGNIVREIDDVKGPISVNEKGHILFIDTEGKLNVCQTNFQAIPPGGSEEAKKKRDEHLLEMKTRFENLKLTGVGSQGAESFPEENIIAQTLRASIDREVGDTIRSSEDIKTLEDVFAKLQAFRSDKANQEYAAVVDEFVEQVRSKLNGIKTTFLETSLNELNTRLDKIENLGDTLTLDEEYISLLELRQGVEITDLEKRREIDIRLRQIETKKDEVLGKYQKELVTEIEHSLPEVLQLINECASTEELAGFGANIHARNFEVLLNNIRDPKVRSKLREEYRSAKDTRREMIESRTRALQEEQRARWIEVLGEVREGFEDLSALVGNTFEDREVEGLLGNPQVIAWRAKLLQLPPELRETEERRLEILFGGRKKDLQHRQELGAVGELGELRFGNVTFPIFKEAPHLWQSKLTPLEGGFPGLSELTFIDEQGKLWRPKGKEQIIVNSNVEDEETRSVIERYRGKAEEYFKNIKRKVPDFDEHWRITDFHMSKLDEVAEALNLQRDNHRGIVILQGEAGTGKNVLVDMLANLSNREVFPVLCNENSAKEDLTFEFYYDPDKGTYKLPSKLVEAIQTPGAVVLFDEINALKPGIAKLLNSLFDYRRRIYLSEGGTEREIIVDPSVIFVGTMNPQNYAGVHRLSPEVKSRARVIDLDYPPFEEVRNGASFWRSDEAEMLAAYMSTFDDLTQNEFNLCWNTVVNRAVQTEGDSIIDSNPQIKEDILRIKDVIRVADRLRQMYEEYQIGDSNEPMDFPTSLREVTDIVMEMNHKKGLREIIKRVIIPKIDDRPQKRLIQQAIDALLPE